MTIIAWGWWRGWSNDQETRSFFLDLFHDSNSKRDDRNMTRKISKRLAINICILHNSCAPAFFDDNNICPLPPFLAAHKLHHLIVHHIICVSNRHCCLSAITECLFVCLSTCVCSSVCLFLSLCIFGTCSKSGKQEATMTVVSIWRSSEARTIFKNLQTNLLLCI